jgi:hypothetical protein
MKRHLQVAAVATALWVLFVVAHAPVCLAAVDQNKFYRHPDREVMLYFCDCDPDGAHGPYELLMSGPQPLGPFPEPDWRVDNSCWMASAACMMDAAGFGDVQDVYVNWLWGGVRPSPHSDPWGGQHTANSGDAFTFDDGGFQYWALEDMGCTVDGPIIEVSDGSLWVWKDQAGDPVDPIAWCLDRLDGTRGIGLGGSWAGRGVKREPRTGRQGGGHAITLWSIVLNNPPDDTSAGRVVVSDSDDEYPGPTQEYVFTYNTTNGWRITGMYEWRDVLWVEDACWIGAGPTAVEPRSWGGIKSLFR